jgi:DNA-binding CsgD family transcriptional regulator
MHDSDVRHETMSQRWGTVVRPRSIIITHREALAAEAIAAALARWPQLVVRVARSLQEAERRAGGADAVAIDARFAGAGEVSQRIRRKGVRVVTLVDDATETESATVPLNASVSHLASVLCPGIDLKPATRSPLTAREHEILSLISQGLAGKQVARHLGISPKTVEHHKTRIFAKLGVPNQTAACLALVKLQSVSAPPFVNGLAS